MWHIPSIDPFVKRSRVSVWKLIRMFGKSIVFHRCRVKAFLVDESCIRIGRYEAWVWVAIEPTHRYILRMYQSRFRNIIVAELFLSWNSCQDVRKAGGVHR